MFLEWHFLLMSLSTILLFTWFIVPYFYLAEIMIRNGYSEQEASTLLSIIGFTNFLGMVSIRCRRGRAHTHFLSSPTPLAGLLLTNQAHFCIYIATLRLGRATGYDLDGSGVGVHVPGHEAHHSPATSAEVTNRWVYTTIPPYFFMLWCLVTDRNNFALTHCNHQDGGRREVPRKRW